MNPESPVELDAVESEDLVRRVRAGDDGASRRLVEHLGPAVRAIVCSHLPRRELEEDLVQEVFVKLFQKLDQYEARPGVPFRHWASRLAVRTCLDALRSERRRPEWRMGDLAEGERVWAEFLMEGGMGVTDGASADADAALLLDRLLGLLPPPDRLVIRWLDLESRSVAEIAALTGWSRPLVKVRAFRARHRLKRLAKERFKNERI